MGIKIKIKLNDSTTLKDSIESLKKKIMDAEVDLTRQGISSIANSLIEVKERINEARGFAELRDIVVPVIKKYDTPKSKEILMKIDEMNRMYQRQPIPGSHNDYWMWERLLKYVYNILLKASGNPSPDVKETKSEKTEDAEAPFVTQKKDGTYVTAKGETFPDKKSLLETYTTIDEKDIKIEDEEDPIEHMAFLLGKVHDAIMEAQDYMSEVNETGKVSSDLEYALDDLEADASELDFMGEDHPGAALLRMFGTDVEEDEDLDELDMDEEWE